LNTEFGQIAITVTGFGTETKEAQAQENQTI